MTKAARRRRMPPRYKSGPKKGRFMSKAARRRKTRRNPRPAVAVNPPRRRRRRARRNPMIGGKYINLRVGGHTGTRPKRRKAAKRTGGSTVAKRKKHVRKAKRSHRSYVLSAKKAARTRAAKKAARRAAAKKSHRKTRRKTTTRRRKHAARRPVTHRRRGAARRRTRKAPLITSRKGTRVRARSRRGGKIRRYRIRARYPRSAKGRLRLSVRRNPGMASVKNMLMDGAMLYGGMLAMRVIKNLFRIHVVEKYIKKATQTGVTAQLVTCLPAVGAFAVGLFAPKFIKSPKLLSGIQAGATIALFDAIFTTFIQPKLGVTATPYLSGGMGYYGGEYIAQRPRLPMMGAVAREAMALDEYVQQPGMGAFDVNEALAGSEVQAMQTGYAGGSLARTLFSS